MNTKEMKHTNGPWAIVNHSWAETTIYGYQRERVANLSIRGEATEETQQEWEDVMEANARLIAASPRMLEALMAVSECLACWVGDGPHEASQLVLKRAKAAIDAATGKEDA